MTRPPTSRPPDGEQRFSRPADADHVCGAGFERDRANLCLEVLLGRMVFDLWDAELEDAVGSDLLSVPRRPCPSSADWLLHALAYARETGLF